MLEQAYRVVAAYSRLDQVMAEYGENSMEAESQRQHCRRALTAYNRVKVNGRRTIDVYGGYHYRTTEDGTLIRTAL